MTMWVAVKHVQTYTHIGRLERKTDRENERGRKERKKEREERGKREKRRRETETERARVGESKRE